MVRSSTAASWKGHIWGRMGDRVTIRDQRLGPVHSQPGNPGTGRASNCPRPPRITGAVPAPPREAGRGQRPRWSTPISASTACRGQSWWPSCRTSRRPAQHHQTIMIATIRGVAAGGGRRRVRWRHRTGDIAAADDFRGLLGGVEGEGCLVAGRRVVGSSGRRVGCVGVIGLWDRCGWVGWAGVRGYGRGSRPRLGWSLRVSGTH